MMRRQKEYGFRFIYLYFASEESRKRIHLARANERQRILREITSFFAFCEGMGSRAEQNFWTDCHWRMSCGCPKWIRFSKPSIVRWLRQRDAPPCDPKYFDLFKNAVPWILMKKYSRHQNFGRRTYGILKKGILCKPPPMIILITFKINSDSTVAKNNYRRLKPI